MKDCSAPSEPAQDVKVLREPDVEITGPIVTVLAKFLVVPSIDPSFGVT